MGYISKRTSNASPAIVIGIVAILASTSALAQGNIVPDWRVKSVPAVQGQMKASDHIELLDPEVLQDFYQKKDGLTWINNVERARGLLAVLDNSWTEGLNPNAYHVRALHAFLDDAAVYQERRAQADLILSDAIMRYGRDVTGMRVDPDHIGQKAAYWRQPMATGQILNLVANAADPVKALTALSPQDATYQALRAEMVRLSREGARHDKLLPLSLGKDGKFRAGGKSDNVPALRTLMNVTHDPKQGPANVYDKKLVEAVKAFQKEHNLQPDGTIGGKTLALLNRSSGALMAQIAVNLERMRWLRLDKNRYVLVNIPSQTLWAIDNGEVALTMPVIVGKPERPTKSFTAEITGVRFNPTWTVPTTIKAKDMLPKLRDNPYALEEKGIEIRDGSGVIDPASVDWHQVSGRQMAQYSMVQPAGSDNALGRVRILMPNQYDIYLHDTNHRNLFSRSERAESSGCVRLSQPEKVASFVLMKNKGWTDKKMKGLIDREKTAEVPTSDKMPVYILYQSVWLDGKGKIIYGADIYGEDKKLLRVLTAMGGYQAPAVAKERVAEAEPVKTIPSVH